MAIALTESLNNVVWIDPNWQNGEPCFYGTRVAVGVLFDYLKGGQTLEETAADVRARYGVQVRTLSADLADSRIDGRVDAHSAVGYFEWTMVFHNTSPESTSRAMSTHTNR